MTFNTCRKFSAPKHVEFKLAYSLARDPWTGCVKAQDSEQIAVSLLPSGSADPVHVGSPASRRVVRISNSVIIVYVSNHFTHSRAWRRHIQTRLFEVWPLPSSLLGPSSFLSVSQCINISEPQIRSTQSKTILNSDPSGQQLSLLTVSRTPKSKLVRW